MDSKTLPQNISAIIPEDGAFREVCDMAYPVFFVKTTKYLPQLTGNVDVAPILRHFFESKNDKRPPKTAVAVKRQENEA